MRNEKLEIKCPLCSKSHTYNLEISRTIIRYFCGTYGPWYDKEFTRLFSCPVKGEKFQATFILSESRENLIDSIEIK